LKEIIVQNILESMSIGLLVIDGQGEIIATNDAVASSLGYTQEDLWGKGWAELFFVEENNEAFNQIIIDVITKQKIKMHQKVPYVKPSGERVQLAITSSYLRDQERAVGMVVLIDDITELERLHENEKRTLEEMNRLQRERVESLNLFAMSVAHQIRNPLTSMGGFATRLFKSMNPQQPNPYLEPIMEGMDRLETIVRAVEEYTAVSRPEMAAVSLREVVDQVLADLDLEASKLK
jgi:PAS domain S-box-containing protein